MQSLSISNPIPCPHKRNILRDQLNELLQQGTIAPVSESEDVPITSPVVLVTKKAKDTSVPDTKEHSLGLYRFCTDMRFLNDQTLNFWYRLPGIQELTESLGTQKLNYISKIDFASSIFQCELGSESILRLAHSYI